MVLLWKCLGGRGEAEILLFSEVGCSLSEVGCSQMPRETRDLEQFLCECWRAPGGLLPPSIFSGTSPRASWLWWQFPHQCFRLRFSVSPSVTYQPHFSSFPLHPCCYPRSSYYNTFSLLRRRLCFSFSLCIGQYLPNGITLEMLGRQRRGRNPFILRSWL